MATYKNGILGAFSGKVGNVIGSSWRGVAYLRSLPNKVRNPRTVAQVRQRTLFSTVSKALRPFREAVRAGYIKTGKASALNAAFANNYNRLVTADTDAETFSIAPADLVLTNGSVTFPIAIESPRSGEYAIKWDAPVPGQPLYESMVYVTVYDADTQSTITYSFDSSSELANIDATAIMSSSADKMHVFAFAANNAAASCQTYMNA